MIWINMCVFVYASVSESCVCVCHSKLVIVKSGLEEHGFMQVFLVILINLSVCALLKQLTRNPK